LRRYSTGQIAVQLAKLAGHTVVATCGGDAKQEMLKVGRCMMTLS
jgi:NADPH-dependent curcumin reductase CurA